MKIVFIILAFAAVLVHSPAQEWTRFRGPNGSGISHAKTIPTEISDQNIVWKVELPGTGHSSPVLWGEEIFLTSTGDKAGGISVLCLSAKDGKLIWRRDFSLNPFAKHQFNSFASSTPAVDAERVYVAWNEPEHYMLTSIDHKGEVLWQRDFGPFVSQHGCGISPIVYKNMVVLGNEQDDAKVVKENPRSGKSFIVAVDSKTGKTIWETPRKSAVVSYATPCIYQPKNAKSTLVFTSQAHGIYGLDPDTGKVAWEFDEAFDKRCVSSPLLAGDIILGTCGQGGGASAVTAVNVNEATPDHKPELSWQIKKSVPYVPTGIARGNMVWLWNDAGIITCLNATNGNMHFQERVGGNYFGSPVWIDGRLFCVSTEGEIVVLEASDKFKVLHKYPLKELCHSTPAVALGKMFIRTEKHLWCIGKAE